MTLRYAIAAALCLGATAAGAAPVDLSSWIKDGNGSWSLEAGNNGVFQSANSPPTVYHNQDATSQGKKLSGIIEVQETGGDDDFVGFVLGYTHGDIDGNIDTDYLLIDWKQGDQSGWGAGMSISRVTGAIQTGGASTGSDLWQHTGVVDFITRSNAVGALYANTGWADRTEYTFDLVFTSTNVQVLVDGNLEIDISAADAGVSAFADGAFGFFNFSQPRVRYAGIEEAVLPPPDVIPLPAGLPLLAAGLGALALLRRKRA